MRRRPYRTIRAAAGNSGYSSTGSVCNVKRALPHVITTLVPSEVMSTGRSGRDRPMSASSRPETSTVPGSATSAVDGNASGHLVVEGRARHCAIGGVDPQAGEHRDGWTVGQRARGPRDRIGEYVAFEPELHRFTVLHSGNARLAADVTNPHPRRSGPSFHELTTRRPSTAASTFSGQVGCAFFEKTCLFPSSS